MRRRSVKIGGSLASRSAVSRGLGRSSRRQPGNRRRSPRRSLRRGSCRRLGHGSGRRTRPAPPGRPVRGRKVVRSLPHLGIGLVRGRERGPGIADRPLARRRWPAPPRLGRRGLDSAGDARLPRGPTTWSAASVDRRQPAAALPIDRQPRHRRPAAPPPAAATRATSPPGPMQLPRITSSGSSARSAAGSVCPDRVEGPSPRRSARREPVEGPGADDSSISARTTEAASSGAVMSRRAPPCRPIGVRRASMMTGRPVTRLSLVLRSRAQTSGRERTATAAAIPGLERTAVAIPGLERTTAAAAPRLPAQPHKRRPTEPKPQHLPAQPHKRCPTEPKPQHLPAQPHKRCPTEPKPQHLPAQPR